MAKTVFILIFTFIVSASIPSPIFAVTRLESKSIPITLGGFSLSPTIGGYSFAGSEQRDVTQSYGLKIGYDKIGKSMADSLGIEGTLNYLTTKSKTDASNATGYLARLDAIYPFIVGTKWMPFFAAGVGGIVINSVSNADKSPLFNYGAGLKYFFENYLAVRIDARQLLIYNNASTHNNFEVGIGISYYFGKERKKKTVPPPATKPISKTSAIPSLDDVLKPSGGNVDEEKNPAAIDEKLTGPQSQPLIPSLALTPLLALESASKLVFQPEAQKENAGVNYLQRAASPTKIEEVLVPADEMKPVRSATETSAPVKVAATPAPAGEKAPEHISATPVVTPEMTTPSVATIPSPSISEERKPEPEPTLPMAAEKTETSPAKIEESVRHIVEKNNDSTLAIEFDSDSSYIKTKFHKKLSELADIMKSSDDISVRIEAHNDTIGDSRHNTMLSEKRAQRVRNSLINLGVDPDRISSAGYEPSQPSADNATNEWKQKKRRTVTLVLLTEGAETMVAPVAAKEAASPKLETVPAPTDEKSQVQVVTPIVTPVKTPPSAATIPSPVIIEKKKTEPASMLPMPVNEGEAVSKPVRTDKGVIPAEEISAPTKTEAAPEPTEKKAPVTTPPPVAPILQAPPIKVETESHAGTETVAVPVATEAIVPIKVRTVSTKVAVVPAPTEKKALVQVATTAVSSFPLAPPIKIDAVVPASTETEATHDVPEAASQAKVEVATEHVDKFRSPLPIWSISNGRYADPRQAIEAAKSNAGIRLTTATGKAGLGTAEPEQLNVVKDLTIEFEFNSSKIESKYFRQIKEIADFLKSAPDSSVLIEGYTDSVGKDSYNLRLSKLRALSIKNNLVNSGIAGERIFTKGFGQTRPIADNTTSEGRQKNRRAVTIVILIDG